MKKTRKNKEKTTNPKSKIPFKKDYIIQKPHTLFIKEVTMAKKGQITIPKAIRDEDGLKENDVFTVTHTYGGDIVFTVKKQKKDPVDNIIEMLRKGPRINANEAWQEILKERKKEHR